MLNNTEKGKKAEEFAVDFLKKKSYSILDVNWRFRKYEIDIIAEKDEVLVIVEVKSRFDSDMEMPYEAVNRKKQRFLIEATNAYIEQKNIDFETRFDIISIIEKNGKMNIQHIEDAFYPLLK